MQPLATATRTSARWKQLPAVAFGLLTLSAGAASVAGSTAEAKTPGKTYCFNRVCHRVKTLSETFALVGEVMTLKASHYDSCMRDSFNPCGLTSSGEKFRAHAPDNAASPIFPDGTTLLVWSAHNFEALIVRINNAGPYWGDRKLDLSRAAADRLGVDGVSTVKVKVLRAPEPHEAVYRRNRVYKAVAGPIGQFTSIDQAYSDMNTVIALAASPFGSLTGGAPFPGLKLLAEGKTEGASDAALAKVATTGGISAPAPDPKPVVAVDVAPADIAISQATAASEPPPVQQAMPLTPAKHAAPANREKSLKRIASRAAARKAHTAALMPVRRPIMCDHEPIHAGFTTYAEAHDQVKSAAKAVFKRKNNTPSAVKVIASAGPQDKPRKTGAVKQVSDNTRSVGKGSPG